jgi:fumarate reductase flavoprotein subunit
MSKEDKPKETKPQDNQGEKILETKVSRRRFVTGTIGGLVIGAAAGAAVGSLGFPKTTTETQTESETTTETTVSTMTTTKTYSFMTPPVIPTSEIKETVNTDIVVVGSGISGCAAAASAAESGAKVVMLEKYSKSTAPGEFHGAINTSDLIAAGKSTDADAFASTLFEFSEGRADLRLLKQWAENSGNVMDWLLGVCKKTNTNYFTIPMEATGLDYLFGPSDMLANGIGYSEFPVVYQMLTSYGQGFGMEVRYSTQGLLLIRPNNQGPVTGIIAKNSDGSYTQFNVSKAVILCTGDIANNPEMVEKYIPWTAYNLKSAYVIGTNTGDGLAMALWAGANVPDEPGCGMVHFFSTNKVPIIFGRPIMSPGLYVNKFGDRFADESQPNEYLAPIVMRQPGQTWWQIFDSKSVTTQLKSTIDTMLTTGEVTSANTIEALAATFGADATRLAASVARYNQMVAAGKDSDFGKAAAALGPANDTAPYYACESPPDYLVGVHGPLTNTSMQVLDTNDQPISGLYAAGNCTSGFFGDGYPMHLFGGLAKGHALTTGRLAGLNAATGSTS